MSRAELENKMAVLLGGRAAEAVIFDEISTGAADDLARATDIARSMVARYGMTEELGPVAYDEEPSRLLGMPLQMPGAGRRYSEQSAAKIDDAVRLLIEAAFSRARAIIVRHHALIDAAAKELLSHETLSERDLAALFPREALRQPEEKAPTAARA
jgi:cell division protease FtsH